MEFQKIGEIIATRTLYFADDSGSTRIVSVFLGRPQPIADQSGYQCPFQIAGIGNERTQFAKGYDSIRALQAAMILIGASLNHFNQTVSGRLRWEGGHNGDLGFP